MSDLRFNSAAGAVLASVLGVMGLGIAAEHVVGSHYPEKAGLQPAVQEVASGGPAEPSGPPDFGRLFADPAALADMVTRGERVAGQCHSCHDFAAGGPNKIGPNLHDVFGREAATHPGFEYSAAMHEHTGPWDYLRLNDFLHAPGTVVRGTKMAFAGVRNDTDRVALIAYLRSISPNNVPLPAPLPEAAPAEGAAPADAAAPAGASAAPGGGAPAAPTAGAGGPAATTAPPQH